MPIEIQQVPAAKQPRTGELVQFNFNNPVIDYAIGIKDFTLTYGTSGHWVESLMINILPGQDPAQSALSKQVTAQVQLVMQDKSGNTVNFDDSFIRLVCIAVTGSPQPNTVVGSAIGISNGTSQQITMPSQQSGYSIATCFQSGFNLTYAETQDDHEVLQATAGCALTHAGQSGQILASANLRDSSGHQVSLTTVDAGYIVSSSPTPGMAVKEVRAQTTKNTTVTMDTMATVSAAAVVIRSWNVQYPDTNHYVNTIQVGSFHDLQISGNVVTIPDLYAWIYDTSGNGQIDAQSYCDALVIAVP